MKIEKESLWDLLPKWDSTSFLGTHCQTSLQKVLLLGSIQYNIECPYK